MAKLLRPIHANAGINAWYRKRLIKELDAMQRSIAASLLTVYRRRESEIVGDASPTMDIVKRFRENVRRWMKRWDTLSEWLSERFVGKAEKTTTGTLKEAFKAAGFTVKFNASKSLNTVTRALIEENVNLIKSIPQKYLTEVEGIVLRGVSNGRDVGFIAQELGKRYEITKRRAKMIARDQTDKAFQTIQRTRDAEIGVTEGIWVHLPGRYTSRKTHIAMNGKRFKLSGPDAGLYDSDVGHNVVPGECVNCRCVYRAIVPEFGD